MLSENIKNLRKTKGLSQEGLAIKLNVVRQTVSKWEKGLSVPDSEMLIRIAEELDTSVNVLLGETVEMSDTTELQALATKLELLNERFARDIENRRRIRRWFFIVICVVSLFCLAKGIVDDIIYLVAMNEINGSGTVIGGFDGPTQIFVSSGVFRVDRIIVFAVMFVISFVGIYKTKRG